MYNFYYENLMFNYVSYCYIYTPFYVWIFEQILILRNDFLKVKTFWYFLL